MTMSDAALAFESIARLSGRIGSGQLSPVKVVEELLGRIEKFDGRLHSFIRVMPEHARAEARAAEMALKNGASLGPLHCIPYAAKDLFDVKGVPTTAGSHLLENNVAREDSTVVRKLNAAGMVLLGKTHTVQFAYGAAGIMITARRITPGMRSRTHPADHPAAALSQLHPAWCHLRSARTRADRFECPRPCAE